jgi:predicted dienelactone hydrolase
MHAKIIAFTIHDGITMKKTTLTALAALMTLTMAMGPGAAMAAGFQRALAADPGGKPLDIGIWYPSKAVPAPVAIGPAIMSVAANGPVEGRALPLIVISHGTGSSFMGHHDTAVALADAGYVVAAVSHTGDNHADQSRSVFIMDRPRQMSRVIDHMLAQWGGRGTIDPDRIGMFGFSAGGFTTLVSIGGLPDLASIAPACREHPQDYACQLIARNKQAAETKPANDPMHERRIRAAVVAAPALGFTFAGEGLRHVTIPVQLWRAEDDLILPHPRYAEAVRLALPAAPDYRVASKAGHFDFLAPCSSALANLAPVICKSGAGFDREAFHAVFNGAVIAFFGKHLGPGRPAPATFE